VKEVIDAAKRITGRDIPINAGPRRSGDPAVLVAKSDRIAKALGWNPRESSLDAIVRSAWTWETTLSRTGEAARS
jgi:UDP-glucose 4-epimerase